MFVSGEGPLRGGSFRTRHESTSELDRNRRPPRARTRCCGAPLAARGRARRAQLCQSQDTNPPSHQIALGLALYPNYPPALFDYRYFLLSDPLILFHHQIARIIDIQ